ncbi:MAG: NAD-dependent epimerase/dehydratase family protein [Lysobacterales bacterium]
MSGKGRVVIPGGTGYLGGRIAESLAQAGYDVAVGSRAASNWPGPGRNIIVHTVNWHSPVELDRMVRGAEAVVMLAAANEIDAASDPVSAAENTATQCLAWLQAAARQQVPRFIYFSTIHVYGANDGTLIHEHRELKPQHPYASTHAAAEIYVQAAHRHGDLDATIFRLSNAFGAPVDPAVNRWTLLLNDLARQAVTTGRLQLKTDGLQARDFVGIGAVCEAVRLCLSRMPGDSGPGVYNLGSGESRTVLEMAQTLASRASAILGQELQVERPAPKDDRSEELPYLLSVDNLAHAGMLTATDRNAEIDQLIAFCRTHSNRLRQQ